MAGFGGLGRIWQNVADCRQIAVRLPSDCRQIAVRLLSRGRSIIAVSVETGGRVHGVTGVSRDTYSIIVRNI